MNKERGIHSDDDLYVILSYFDKTGEGNIRSAWQEAEKLTRPGMPRPDNVYACRFFKLVKNEIKYLSGTLYFDVEIAALLHNETSFAGQKVPAYSEMAYLKAEDGREVCQPYRPGEDTVLRGNDAAFILYPSNG